MKKGLKIGGIVIGVILILMIAIPFLFKDKIKVAVIDTANTYLNAELKIDKFGLNLFSNFPNATLSLNDMSINGINDFAGDTLVKAKAASLTINIMSLFNGNYEVSKIELDNASVHAKMLADGRANWDIVKPDSTETDEKSTPFNLSLKKISIKNSNIIYEDQASNMKMMLIGWDGNVSGDFTASETKIETQSEINEISFIMNGIPYLNKIKGTANATIKAHLENMEFTFEKSELTLNEVKAGIDGYVAIGETDMNFDLKLNAPNTQFKDILSILPSMYTDEFKNIKTSGSASLDAYVKGVMNETTYPAFKLKLLVENAMFQYPSLPKAVKDINVDVLIENKGGSLDNTIIDISKFNFNMGGNPFSVRLNIQTPISDPSLKAHANGNLDLGMIKDIYPLEKGVELNGKLIADMDIATRMSYIEKEKYEDVTASGHLKVNNMIYKSADMKDVVIDEAGLEFTPKFVNLISMNVKIGKNDIAATGRLENFIGYALKDQTLKGQLNIKSNYLNVNDFMGDEKSATTVDTTSVGVFEIPKNIDFALNANLNKVLYDKITLTNVNGSISVKNGAITMNNVSANTLGGSAKVNGSYSTAANPKKPKVDFALNLSKVSFAETFKSVEAIRTAAPIFERITGNYSMNLKFNATLGESLMQILGTLTGDGALQTDEVKIEGVEALDQISSAMKLNSGNSLKSFSTKDLNIPFHIEDGKIITKPFDVNIGTGGKLNLAGSTSLNQTIDYKGTVTLPKSMSNSFVNNVGLIIGGTFDKPKVSIDTKALLDNAVGNIAGQLLGGSADGKKEDLGTKITEEKTKQIQKLRNEAQSASDNLVKAADEQGQKLVKETKNPFAKAAAQVAAKKIVEEAKKQGQKLIDQAEAEAQKLEVTGATAK